LPHKPHTSVENLASVAPSASNTVFSSRASSVVKAESCETSFQPEVCFCDLLYEKSMMLITWSLYVILYVLAPPETDPNKEKMP